MECSEISAVIVTKGDQDLMPILESLSCFNDVVVWDNSKRPMDLKVLGRYVGALEAKHDFIYVQDDDCIVPVDQLLTAANGSALWKMNYRMILCNIPSEDHRKYYEPLGMSLVGWGAIFHRKLIDFHPYSAVCDCDELFLRECDRIFTSLHPCVNVSVPIQHLAHAHGKDRMSTEARHGSDLREIRMRVERIRLGKRQ